jgi:L-aspartate oxidase
MSRYAGVIRDADGLARLLREITGAGGTCGPKVPSASVEASEGACPAGDLDLEAVEAENLRLVSLLIVEGARRRMESRGCHRRRDATSADAVPSHTLARWDGSRLVVTQEEL